LRNAVSESAISGVTPKEISLLPCWMSNDGFGHKKARKSLILWLNWTALYYYMVREPESNVAFNTNIQANIGKL
jgi:hypothetical protein